MEKNTIYEEDDTKRTLHGTASSILTRGWSSLVDVKKETSSENESPLYSRVTKPGLVDSGWSSLDDAEENASLEKEITKERPSYSRVFQKRPGLANTRWSSVDESGRKSCFEEERKRERPLFPLRLPPKQDEYHDELFPSYELVTQERLNELWVKAKDNEEEKMKVLELCNDICSYIVNKHSNKVLSVWPTYESNDNSSIVFVLNTKERIDETELGLEYSTVARPKNTYSEEATLLMNSEANKQHKLSFTESENIRQAINNKAKELMQCHKNLSVISGSGVRSKNFKQGPHEIIKQACVVLYVHTKGKIPLDETEFPNCLDGIPVDVREGEFHTCVSAKEYQHTLQMGCQIESGKMGTLGGFVDHPEYGLSAITCAHVVLDDEELHDLRRNSKKIWRFNEKPVYQPDSGDVDRNHCGQVKEALYKAGTGDQSGVDLAIFQILKRAPDSGTFPDVSNFPTDMVYETGKLCSSVYENHNQVMKFGCTTDKTEGFVQFSNSAVRLIEYTRRYSVCSNDYTYSLFNQFEIRPLQQTFVQPGDSGSLVFKKDVSGDLLCIGMVVGVLEPSGNGIVIPISAIKSELGVSELKNFSWNMFRRMDLRLSNIEECLRKLANK